MIWAKLTNKDSRILIAQPNALGFARCTPLGYFEAGRNDAERMARDTELSAAGFKPAQRVYNTFGATNDE